MKRILQICLAVACLMVGNQRVLAHCEVPCGIYADQVRFQQMLEDHQTIAKGMAQIGELAGKSDPQSVNQTVRWVNTKESHATNTQHIVAQYFMTQRIKPGTDAASQASYVKKLTAAHAVMVAAMKCKQSTDPATAGALREAILNLYRAYEGKEPQLEE